MKLRLHHDAALELDAAADWYDDQRPGLGNELVIEANRVLVAIRERPSTWPRSGELEDEASEIRRARMTRFPYAVAYRIDAEEIVVLAFAHDKRDALYWLRRADPEPDR